MSKMRSVTSIKSGKRKVSGMRCSVRFCKNSTLEKTVSFFNYPNEIERRALWIKACETHRKVSFNPKRQNSLRVCGDHFEKKMFLNKITKNRLVFNAVPTLFNDEILEQRRKLKKRTIYSELIKDTDDEIISEVDFENPNCSFESSLDISYNSSQIEPSLSENSSNELCIENYIAPGQNKIKQLENAVVLLSQQLTKYESEENVLKFCDKYLSPELFEMVKLQMDVKLHMDVKSQIKVETEEDKYVPKCV